VSTRTILIVNEDREAARAVAGALLAPDRDVRILASADEAVACAPAGTVDLVVTDTVFTSTLSALDIVQAYVDASPRTRVVVLSKTGSIATTIDALRAGAFDCLAKPVDVDALQAAADRDLALAGEAPGRDSGTAATPLLGRAPAMLQLYAQMAPAAAGVAPVLILGESGTGKELVARALHAQGARASQPFLTFNCAAMTPARFASALFGHVGGVLHAGPDARTGLLVAAGGGTVLLDNVTELTPSMQASLLKVLQEREVKPAGATAPVPVEARLMATTTADMDAEVAARRFRQDLFHRLAVFLLRVPPLRHRRQDIPLLVEHFSRGASSRAGRVVTISSGAIARLRQMHWPGNVRELENVIEHLVASSPSNVIETADTVAIEANPSVPAGTHPFADMPTLDELERRYLVYALQRFAGNRTRTAAALGIDRRTLYRMSARLGVPITGAEIHGDKPD
jgi:DNA-binding NtrC family response regulator